MTEIEFSAETQAPGGYIPFSGTVKFTVDQRGIVTIIPNSSVSLENDSAGVYISVVNKADPGNPGNTGNPSHPGNPGNSNTSGSTNLSGNLKTVDSGSGKTSANTSPATADTSSLVLYSFMFLLSGALIASGKSLYKH